MRTRNRVITLLIVALTGSAAAVAAGQDNSAKSQASAQRKPSQTRAASCLVRITVDPAIIPLDPATVQGLLQSSAVAGKAVREVLHLDSWDNPWETLVEIEWLNESSPRSSRTTAFLNEESALKDREMLQELESIYGKEYVRQMSIAGSKSSKKPDQPVRGYGDSMYGSSDSMYGPYDTRTRPNPRPPTTLPRSAPGGTSSATIRLLVHLPDGVPPAADEFLAALVENLEGALFDAYASYSRDLRSALDESELDYRRALDTLQGGADPATVKIREQLDKIVDLSSLDPQMPLADAVETLRNSVEPPLNIVVLWTDLRENLSVEPSTPINISGMSSVKLGTALDLLVKGVSSANAKPMWKIKGGVIVIATAAGLGESDELPGQPKAEIDIQVLAAQRTGMANQLKDIELNLAGQEARRRAIAEQMDRTYREAHARLAEDQVTKELESLVELSAENLSNLRKQADAGLVSVADMGQATENLTRARIELAKRREELSKQVGGGQLDQLTGEMSRMAIDRAEKEAQRDILNKQLAQVQQQLAQASTFDLDAARLRMAREALDILARRVAELQVRIANLQRPMVTTIGAN